VSEQRLEVADVFRRYGQEFLDRWGYVLSRQQLKVFRDIGACRTAALGNSTLLPRHHPAVALPIQH
jgi:hypothetical protein